MSLKYETWDRVVNYQDLEEFIEANLGRSFEVQQYLQAGQDTVHHFMVKKTDEPEPWVEKWINDLPLDDDEWLDLEGVLAELANRNLLEEGPLTIYIWW